MNLQLNRHVLTGWFLADASLPQPCHLVCSSLSPCGCHLLGMRSGGLGPPQPSTLPLRIKPPLSASPCSACGTTQGLGVGWYWGGKPESSPGQEAQCLAGFLGPAKEGAEALSYRGRLGQGRGGREGVSVSPWTWEPHSKPGSTDSSQRAGPMECWEHLVGDRGYREARETFILSSPLSQARPLYQAPLSLWSCVTAEAAPEEGSPSTLRGEGATSRRLPSPLPVVSLATSVSKYIGSWLAA